MEFVISLTGMDEFARQFWAMAGDKKRYAFHGQMGAGKTTVITALCREKGVRDGLSSPTFSIINEYEAAGARLYHIDLYRLKDEQEVVQAGVEDCLYSGFVCMVEWPEKAPALFEEGTVHVFIEPLSDTERKISIQLP
ncbi:MAG TPA: tRNA (adenosine(37)-N6)-threonylcarbamoyltransferase complex ATPase subunit type 1 TsaE [Flavisolibacter sp.]|nr:tRNA (adenosine(37)-N6)-threonylcarbamoyltransferase complex ATPase subunit type 1 TsaE [Flavisolibacter sp.]